MHKFPSNDDIHHVFRVSSCNTIEGVLDLHYAFIVLGLAVPMSPTEVLRVKSIQVEIVREKTLGERPPAQYSNVVLLAERHELLLYPSLQGIVLELIRRHGTNPHCTCHKIDRMIGQSAMPDLSFPD